MKSVCASRHMLASLGAFSLLKMRCSEITSNTIIGLKILLKFQSNILRENSIKEEWPGDGFHIEDGLRSNLHPHRLPSITCYRDGLPRGLFRVC